MMPQKSKAPQRFMATKKLCIKKSNKLDIKKPNSTCSRYIPVEIKRMVWERSSGQCEHISHEGVRCGSEYQLQYDHVKPLTQGGCTEASNMRMLCRVHNVSEASRMGIGFETTSYFQRAKS